MEMQDDMKGNSEESLRRALAEFAVQTASGGASDSVRHAIQRQVRARMYRRCAFGGLAAALATAAALSIILFGVATRPARLVLPSQPPKLVLEGHTPANSTEPAPVAVIATAPKQEPARGSAAGVRPDRVGTPSAALAGQPPPSPKRPRGSRKREVTGDWRKGEIELSPWYYNTALPPTARSVLVRSEVDARTAMRFGVLSAGDTAPVEVLFGEDGLPRAMRFVRHLPTQKN
jgi:hypothetical protein